MNSISYLVYTVFWCSLTIGGSSYVVFWRDANPLWIGLGIFLAECCIKPKQWAQLMKGAKDE